MSSSPPPPSPRPESPRLLSLDSYRGLIMCTLALSGLSLATTAKRLGYGPEAETDSLAGWFWQTLAFHTSHPPWNSQFHFVGVSYWDLIQPAFMFMVGVAMPYSYAKRQRQGDPATRRALHALIRALVLILLGVFLQTRSSGLETNRLLTNVLAQIGLGYFFVYSVMSLSARMQIALGAAVLVLYNAWMLAWPAPETLGATAAESIADLTVPESVARHFALGVNAAAEADVRLLRFLTGSDSIDAHRGGYATLNFIPSAVTILLGVLAGNLLRSTHSASVKVRRLFVGGAICMALAVVASFTGCPVVKRLWTPSWTLYSGAYVLWALALLYWVIDVRHWRRWTFPLVVVGTNSLAMYLMSMLWKGWIATRFEVYLGSDVFSGLYGATLQSLCVFAVLWLICLYLYRNKLFFRI